MLVIVAGPGNLAVEFRDRDSHHQHERDYKCHVKVFFFNSLGEKTSKAGLSNVPMNSLLLVKIEYGFF